MPADCQDIVEALPAASIVLIRDGLDGLEVLMMERAATMRFAPKAFVFPGGQVDPDDGNKAFWGDKVNVPNDLDDFSYRIAAVRELYEEASVLLTEQVSGTIDTDLDFKEHALKPDAVLDLNSLVPFAHWVTPEQMPRRFDTYFYIIPHNGQEAVHDGNEAVSLRWVQPKRILEDWDADKVPLMFPTRLNLIKLARAKTVAEAIEQARGEDVVRIMPEVRREADSVSVCIDSAAGYGVTKATEKELRIERPK